MKIAIISVGKKHSPEFLAAIELYTKRIQHFADITWILLPDSGLGPAGITKEAEQISNRITPNDTVIVLDEVGKQFTSKDVSTIITQSVPPGNRLVFVIGGAFGVTQQLRSSAYTVWSLGQLTLPHQLVRTILVEQIYRAFAIANNLPYHHA